MSFVVIRVKGGLGNQMFQYAAGRAVALRCGVPLKLDLSGFADPTERPYALDAMAIEATPAVAADLAPFGKEEPSARGPWARLLGVRCRLRRWRGRRDGRLYEERVFHFDPRVRSLSAPVYLDGYFQSERYFRDVRGAVARELSLRAPLDPANAAMAASIRESDAVSLHVRRGDYVTKVIHGTCSLAYYRAALAHVVERVPGAHFYVFSDEPGWARENLGGLHPMTFVTHNPPERGAWDMHLMSLCRHHVIANSTFSWWGAWLSTWPDKIVVAPRPWFASAPWHDTRDLLPVGWVELG